MINVKVELKETSQKIELEAQNTYTKGPLFCVYTTKGVQKFPLANVWRITEDYDASS
jgi:hypothetical protein